MRIDDAATVRRAATAAGPDAPLLVVLHGYGANERDLVALLPLLGHDGDAAFLRAPLPLWPRAWAWFPLTLGDTHGDLGAQASEVAAAAQAVTAWLAEHAADRTVILVGFSQGGAVALQVLRSGAAGVRALVVLSGFVAGVEDPLLSAHDARLASTTPVFFAHGDADTVIPRDLTAATSRWLAAHTRLTERRYPRLPHGVDTEVLADVRTFLAARE